MQESTKDNGLLPTGLAGGMIVLMGVLGLVGLLTSYASDGAAAARFFANWVLWYVVLLSIGLGALFLIALEHLVSARWSVPLRRIPERLSSLMVLLFPLALVALWGVRSLYLWAGPGAAGDEILQAKAVWLNVPFFTVRSLACLGLWLLFFVWLVRGSYRQDQGQAPEFPGRAKRLAAAFMIVFGVTVTVAAFDWLMSLEPHWFSTIMGVYLFSGCMVAGLAGTTLVVIYLLKAGRLPGIKPDHLYNLGALMFGFNAFWAYIAFSQFMLIWYANLPEETGFFYHRLHGPWLGVTVLLPIVHFFIPFFALLSRDAKCDTGRLRWVAIWLLASHVIDVYWLVFPSLGQGVLLGWPEVAFAFFFVALTLVWVRGSLRVGWDMPVGDPNLRAGLEFSL